jgi:hypothetical protein
MAQIQHKRELARSLQYILQVSKTGKQHRIKAMRKDIETSDYLNGQDSRLWLAVAVSFMMIFTSYAVSVLNHRSAGEISAHTQPNRSIVVSYLA